MAYHDPLHFLFDSLKAFMSIYEKTSMFRSMVAHKLRTLADNRQTHVRDPVAAMEWGELPSHAPAPVDPAVQKQVTTIR